MQYLPWLQSLTASHCRPRLSKPSLWALNPPNPILTDAKDPLGAPLACTVTADLDSPSRVCARLTMPRTVRADTKIRLGAPLAHGTLPPDSLSEPRDPSRPTVVFINKESCDILDTWRILRNIVVFSFIRLHYRMVSGLSLLLLLHGLRFVA